MLGRAGLGNPKQGAGGGLTPPAILKMTDSQKAKYWRRWAACARANRWTMISSRLNALAILDASEHHCAVHAAALQLAAAEAKGLNAGHLRHGCHVVAIGRDKSHTKFSNKEFDALLNYWGDERAITGLLILPEDLAAAVHEAAPELKQRERLLIVLRRDFLEGYIVALCERIHGRKDWEQLPGADLEVLHHILLDRPNARKSSVQSPTSKVEEPDPDWTIA